MFNLFKKKESQYKPIICILINNEDNSLELHTDPDYSQDPLIKTLAQRIADHVKENYLNIN